ncbi:acyl-CoA dehydrogenase family protein [Sphaerotilus natans]|uniref:acyl-CoA dehydrogenase family protein n=1 Tax=Sphaerotilus natans TaxID=34103 RepID=UPI00406D0D27
MLAAPDCVAFAAVPAHLNPVIQGDLWLEWIAREGLTALALPPEAGGQGGTLAELGRAARALARHSPGAARVLWAQRLCIEQLHAAHNRAVADYLLPDLIAGHRAGACLLPCASARVPLAARRLERGWRLQGRLGLAANLQWAGFVLVAPACFEGGRRARVLLSGDDDGLRRGPDRSEADWHGTRTAELQAQALFFRDDEILDAEDMLPDPRVAEVDRVLRAALA